MENPEEAALYHLKKVELRFQAVRLLTVVVVSILTALAVIYFIRRDNADNLSKIKANNAQTASDVEKKVNDGNENTKRFMCSLAIQLTHSTQSVDDCVISNKLSEIPVETQSSRPVPSISPQNSTQNANPNTNPSPQANENRGQGTNNPQSDNSGVILNLLGNKIHIPSPL